MAPYIFNDAHSFSTTAYICFGFAGNVLWSISSMENAFVGSSALHFMRNNWWALVAIIVGYGIFLYYAVVDTAMPNRYVDCWKENITMLDAIGNPGLRRIKGLQNILQNIKSVLLIVSLVGVYKTVPFMYTISSTRSFSSTVCDSLDNEWEDGASGMWVAMTVFLTVGDMIVNILIASMGSYDMVRLWYPVLYLFFFWVSYTTRFSPLFFLVGLNYFRHFFLLYNVSNLLHNGMAMVIIIGPLYIKLYGSCDSSLMALTLAFVIYLGCPCWDYFNSKRTEEKKMVTPELYALAFFALVCGHVYMALCAAYVAFLHWSTLLHWSFAALPWIMTMIMTMKTLAGGQGFNLSGLKRCLIYWILFFVFKLLENSALFLASFLPIPTTVRFIFYLFKASVFAWTFWTKYETIEQVYWNYISKYVVSNLPFEDKTLPVDIWLQENGLVCSETAALMKKYRISTPYQLLSLSEDDITTVFAEQLSLRGGGGGCTKEELMEQHLVLVESLTGWIHEFDLPFLMEDILEFCRQGVYDEETFAGMSIYCVHAIKIVLDEMRRHKLDIACRNLRKVDRKFVTTCIVPVPRAYGDILSQRVVLHKCCPMKQLSFGQMTCSLDHFETHNLEIKIWPDAWVINNGKALHFALQIKTDEDRTPDNKREFVITKKISSQLLPVVHWWCKDIADFQVASFLAGEFNDAKNKLDGCASIVLNERSVLELQEQQSVWMIRDAKLSGCFETFNDSKGYCAPCPTSDGTQHDAVQAFSHWSHVRSSGIVLVVNCQGVFSKQKNVFQLTAPVVHYQPTKRELGIATEADKFFGTHYCNDICRQLKLPRIKHL